MILCCIGVNVGIRIIQESLVPHFDIRKVSTVSVQMHEVRHMQFL
jgi:hypothetical protein